MALHWRPLWRTFTTLLLVAVPVAALLLFAWFTQNPDSPAVDRAREWRYVGPWIARLQDYWRPPPVASPGDRGDGPDVIVYYYPAHPPPRDYVWVAGGTALRAAPSPEAEPVLTIEETTNLFFYERRGDWVRVHRGAVEGWVLSPPGSGVAGRRDDRPAPVLPLPGRAPEPETLKRALEAFSSPPVLARVDPYLAYTDAEAEAVGADCRALVASSEERWASRYRVIPQGEAAEAILLFSDRAAYERFHELAAGELRTGELPTGELANGELATGELATGELPTGELPTGASGHSAAGLVATFAAGRSGGDLCRTLLHEIAHLLARRSLGPALPLWLDEGLAVDFTAELLGEALAFGEVSRAVRSGSAPDLAWLVALDSERFHGASRPLHYALSGAWVRYLASDADLEGGFRSFLQYLSRGGPWAEGLGERDFPAIRATPSLGDDLLYFLGREVERLEAGFRVWLWARGPG